MTARLIRTNGGSAALVARIVLAAVMFPHGAQHVLGWFGGYGFGATLDYMADAYGFPTPLLAIAILTELLAPIALLLGLVGRVAALGIFSVMLVAATTHFEVGFFMNWFGQYAAGSEGYEFHLLAMALSGVVMIAGSGAWSVDAWLSNRSRWSTHGTDGAQLSRAA